MTQSYRVKTAGANSNFHLILIPPSIKGNFSFTISSDSISIKSVKFIRQVFITRSFAYYYTVITHHRKKKRQALFNDSLLIRRIKKCYIKTIPSWKKSTSVTHNYSRALLKLTVLNIILNNIISLLVIFNKGAFLAPLESASIPSWPEPANKSRTFLSSISNWIIEKQLLWPILL